MNDESLVKAFLSKCSPEVQLVGSPKDKRPTRTVLPSALYMRGPPESPAQAMTSKLSVHSSVETGEYVTSSLLNSLHSLTGSVTFRRVVARSAVTQLSFTCNTTILTQQLLSCNRTII